MVSTMEFKQKPTAKHIFFTNLFRTFHGFAVNVPVIHF